MEKRNNIERVLKPLSLPNVGFKISSNLFKLAVKELDLKKYLTLFASLVTEKKKKDIILWSYFLIKLFSFHFV